jgi:phosphate transport system permease protein
MQSNDASTVSTPPTAAGFVGRRWWERLIGVLLLACASVSILTTVGIVVVLLIEASSFFAEVSIWEFVTGTKWRPRSGDFGILPLLCGTLLVTGGAATVAIPIGLGTAIYLSEYATPRVREIIKPVLEVLAGIPSVVYGFLAVILVSPIIRAFIPFADASNAVSAGIVVGIMVLPLVVSLSEDVLRSVPRSLREAAYALGATKFDVVARVVVPAALSGIMASFLLAVSRAIGETMAVTLAAGLKPTLTLNPFSEVQTMTGYIVETSKGDTQQGTPQYLAIFAVALSLFVITMLLNLISQWILSRMREKYE